jgi:polar amino acid transport system ATP-binding protein
MLKALKKCHSLRKIANWAGDLSMQTAQVHKLNAAVPKIEVREISKAFGRHKVLKSVSLKVAPGEKAVIIGASGSGKSTLLRSINYLVEPDSGTVLIDGEPYGIYLDDNGIQKRSRGALINSQRARMPMVFQRFNLFQNRTVIGNVMEAQVVVLRRSKAEAEASAVQALMKVGLLHKAGSFPTMLSGGEQQRVAIARALAMNPDIILFDEPTSSLDPELVGEVLEIMCKLAAEGMTMIVVTHEMEFARRTADNVYFFGAGKIIESGSPQQIFDDPKQPSTQNFIRAILGSTVR